MIEVFEDGEDGDEVLLAVLIKLLSDEVPGESGSGSLILIASFQLIYVVNPSYYF